ncbi:TlpA disulfide reductase family protein [uncultured Pontibacter sp.]|uniref:TlpA disulfide reductase family protein n=1 Tax=uncultured Pontibacter sp. TaxID=453356 RepID=UPI002630BEEC|nr:TlpA disulfide reductase family protein [uncultured Pontibacter sp.]
MMKLKKYVILASAAALMAGCQGNKTATNGSAYTIEGKLQNATPGQIYLFELGEQQFIARDTANIGQDGSFLFEGTVKEPTFYRLGLDQQNGMMLVLENKKIKVEADASDLNGTAKIEGSEDSELFQQLNKMVNDSRQKEAELSQKFNQAMAEGKTEEAEGYRQQYLAMQKELKNFLAQHPGSIVSAFGTLNLINPQTDFSFADSMATLYSEKIPDSKYTALLNKRLESMRSTAIGSVAPDFSLPTPEGGSIALSSLRGKYVLIDFWASWCAPCRKENPNVVRMYNEYKDKGFEIFGVSLDQSREKWLKAIADDKLTWPQVSDLKGWESSAAQLYQVDAIPQTILLDKEGKIIAKGLRGEELEEKIASLVN